jgi:hypothetical protein
MPVPRRPRRFRLVPRLLPRSVVVRHRATGRFLAGGATWTDDAAAALVLDGAEAPRVVDRFSCEVGAFELLEADADQAVA